MRIIVLSRNPALYSTHSLVRAARNRGHLVRVVDHMLCDIVIDQKNARVCYYDEVLDDYDAIIPRIGNSATKYGAAIIRQFQLLGMYSILDPDALRNSRNKISTMQILAKAGINIPSSMIVNNYERVSEMLDEIPNYPKIIKLVSGTHGIGVIKSGSKQNAETVIETFQKMRNRTIVQEYIGESNGSDLRILVVGGKVVAAMVRQASEGEFRSNLHRGGSSYSVRPTDEEAAVALKAVNVLGLQVAGVDMLRSNRGPLVLEVNASPGLEGIETTTGIDVASRVIQLVERNRIK